MASLKERFAESENDLAVMMKDPEFSAKAFKTARGLCPYCGRAHQRMGREERRVMNVKTAVGIGAELLDRKAALPHGKFSAAARAEFGMSVRTAQRYMKIARRARERYPDFYREATQ